MVPVVGVSASQLSRLHLHGMFWEELNILYPVPVLSLMCFLQLILADSQGHVASICINKTFRNLLRQMLWDSVV